MGTVSPLGSLGELVGPCQGLNYDSLEVRVPHKPDKVHYLSVA